jgi:hypothetical protein
MSKVTDDVEITEIVELQAHKMSGVGSPANGTPFLLLKSVAKSDSAEGEAQEEEMTGDTKKGAVQDSLGGTRSPEEAGHTTATGDSGARGPVVTGTKAPAATDDSSYALGGATTSVIPDENKVTTATANGNTDAAGIVNKAVAVASLIEAMDVLDEQRAAIKDGVTIQVDGVTAPTVPLTEVASTLASCARTVEEYLLCERVEAAVNPSESSDVWAMEDAMYSLQSAFKLVANIAFLESLEDDGNVTKAGKVLSAKNVAALEAAHKHLTSVIDGAKDKASDSASETTAKKEILTMADVTKTELAESIVAGVQAAYKAEREAEKAELAEKAEKLEEAKKLVAEDAEKGNVSGGNNSGGTQSNNGGEISEAAIKPTKETDADDVNAVKEGEDGEVVKSDDKPDKFTKQVETQLEALTKGLAAVEQLVTKIAKRPRPGGPSLDGQVRPAAEGRMSDATKSEGDEIEKLTKALDEAKDPMAKSHAALELTRARLVHAHETGQL